MHKSGLTSEVLVINQGYQPVRVTNGKAAVMALFKEIVEVVNIENGDYITYDFNHWLLFSESNHGSDQYGWIRSSKFSFAVPHVIRIKNYNRASTVRIKFCRKNIYMRDNYVCQYSGKRYSEKELTLDHVVPKSRGGTKDWSNIVTCHKEINTRKADCTPEEAGLQLIKQPKQPNYIDFAPKKIIYESWKTFLND